MIAKLALEDGAVFTGTSVGATSTRTGEVVFNTAMTGYQEVFTYPSYCGQIVTMTFPLQGNYGVNTEDFESAQPHLSGVVLKELPLRPSSFRATGGLSEFLSRHGVTGIVGVDTRAVTRRIRTQGALRGVISTETLDDLELVRQARAVVPMAGSNLVNEVTPAVAAAWPRSANGAASATAEPDAPTCHIVAIDCGIKHNIPRLLAKAGCRVTLAPAQATPEEILALAPDGLVAGNGPGDPAAVSGTVGTLRALLGRLPVFGICLGHQLLALALGAKTYKLAFGHHGVNLPVLDRTTGSVAITSQNHGFAVDAESLERVGGEVTHVSLNDGSVEGFTHRATDIVAVQFHPEASPGPHDSCYMFRQFTQTVAARKSASIEPAPSNVAYHVPCGGPEADHRSPRR
ncbi:MAG: glutamine-hydrolyzing carbamoyl-phosphate synthase small subunit [Planctomycetes bacterium]|nr:glutamine-hydrolyzing carbamoyl-phosphate synthase small subunit [Planctomycetota bacterium]